MASEDLQPEAAYDIAQDGKPNARSTTMVVHEMPDTNEIYETILWDPDDELIFESESTDYSHENEAKNILDLGILEDISDSDTYYSQSHSKQMRYSPTPKTNTIRKPSNLTTNDSDSDSSTLSSSSYFTPLPPDEDINEEKQSETIKQFPKAPPLQTTAEPPIISDSGTINQISEEVQIVLSPVQPKAPKIKTQSEPPLLQQSLTQSAKEQSPPVKGTQSLKYHIIPKAKSIPIDQQINPKIPKEKQPDLNANCDSKEEDNAEKMIANDNDIKSDKILDQITEEPNSTETKSDVDETLDNKKQLDTTSTDIEKHSNGNNHDHDTEQKNNQESSTTSKKKVGFNENTFNGNGYIKESLESISENAQLSQQIPPPNINPTAAQLPISNDSQPISPKITITESTDNVQKPISSSMNEFKRKSKSNTGRKARKSRKSSAQKEKKIRKKSRAAKGTIPPPKIPDMVIEEDDGTTYLPVKMVHLFARVRTHHKLHNYRNMNYASKSYQQDPKLVSTILDQQIGTTGECKIANGVYAFVKKNIGTQKEYKLALRANSDDIHHATAMLNFVQSKLDESLEKIKKITKFNHDICIQSIITEMNKR